MFYKEAITYCNVLYTVVNMFHNMCRLVSALSRMFSETYYLLRKHASKKRATFVEDLCIYLSFVIRICGA